MSTSLPCTSFSFTDPATTAIYTLSLHDALPIFKALDGETVIAETDFTWQPNIDWDFRLDVDGSRLRGFMNGNLQDRKSTRLNSSHVEISYAVFCLKKKKETTIECICGTYR